MISKTLAVVFSLIFVCGTVSATDYFVSKNGSDSNNGTSWAAAWLTLGKLYQGTVSPGDRVFIGTGIWREPLQIVHGLSSTQRTIYACSSFAATNGDGEYHFAKIWGSEPVTNWTQYSGNIYSAAYTAASVIMLAQGDHLFTQRQTLAEVDSPGEHYIGNGRIYAHAYDDGDGYDPDSYQMEASNRMILHLEDESGMQLNYSCTTGSHTMIYGLELKYGCPRAVHIGRESASVMGNTSITDVRFEHCKLSHIASQDFSTNNPTLIGTRALDYPYFTDSITVLACSLGYAMNHASSTHGTAVTTYCTNRFTIDSCTFYGYFESGGCIQFKAGYADPSVGNTVKRSLFTPTGRGRPHGVKIIADQYADSVYGNVFIDCDAILNGYQYYDQGDSLGHHFYIYNNTVINGSLITREVASCAPYWPHSDFNVKYNVVYWPTLTNDYIYRIIGEDTLDGALLADSNLFHIGDSAVYVGQGIFTLDDWQTDMGYDVRSRFVNNAADVGFADFDNGDYSRSPVSNEMDLFYGGRRWLYYGANLSPDNTSPDPIDDLRGEYGENHGEIELAWTAPADSESVKVSRYEIMCSLEPLTGLPWKPTVTSYDCHLPGTTESLTVTGLEPGLEHYVAIKSFDERGLASLISNIVITFAGGIMIPPALFTTVSQTASTASLSCDTVSTYYDQITYDFILVDSSTGDIASVNLDAADNPKVSALFEGLNPETVYYWHCRAVTDAPDSSDWSFPKMFRLDNVYPDPPTAYSPLDMDTLIGVLDTLSLTVNNGTDDDSTGQLSYDIELYEFEASFPLADTLGLPSAKPVTSWSVPVELETSTTLRWRARSYDGLDYSFWSDWFQFTLIESSAGGNTALAGTIIAYPNPVHFRDGEYVTFKLPDDPVDLLIQTVSGETVLLRTGISGDWQWFGENGAGNIVATGIYSWFVRGTNQNGKIVVKP